MASRVGQYLLFETLGEGAFGKVKLGVHEETGEQVAVKIMDKSDIRAQEMTMNVRREIAIMKALKHRNIVNLRQVLTSASKLYIVMDLVTGGELFTKILNEGRLEENVARKYFQQLVDGIDYCHRRGVCHRDLKPENLLIDETTGELKITDFGLSAMKGASTTEELLHTQCGSPNYCAPEIIARHRQGYNGAKVDAWSCGIILFALLAGFLPFYDENTKVLYRMIQRDDVKFPRKFPSEAKDLVLRLLHKEPEKRFTLTDVKKHPWFVVGYNGAETRSGNTSSPPTSRAKNRRRHRRTPSQDQAPKSRPGSDNLPTPDKLAAVNAPAVPAAIPQYVQQASSSPPSAPVPPTPQNEPALVATPPASVSVRQPAPPVAPVPPPMPPPAPQAPITVTAMAAVPAATTPIVAAHAAAAPMAAAPVLAAVAAVPRAPPPPPPPMPAPVSPVHSAPYRVPPPIPPPAAAPRAHPVSPKHVVRDYVAQSPNGVSSAPISSMSASPTKPAVPNAVGYPGSGNTLPNDSTSDSLPEVGSDVMFPAPPQFPAPSGSPVTSTSEMQSTVTIPTAPTVDSAATADAGRTILPLTGYSLSPPNAPARSDTSWQRQMGDQAPAPRTDSQPILVPNEVPMSFVEQRKAMYNNLAQGAPTAPAPLPDMSRGHGAANWDSTDMVAPKSTPLPDLSAGTTNWQSPVPMTRKSSAPINSLHANTMQKTFEELPMPFSNGSPANGVHETPRQEENDLVSSGLGVSDAPFMIPEDEEEEKENMKRRRTAALARYRRIFRLGNNIGIVGSPSFNSNNGNPMLVAKDDKNSAATSRAEFFARAKAVTGAWGIILTQELEEDSDSEDEGRQVTEDELQAFGRLLDFWDSRRASAKINKQGEAVLDDDSMTPLSEKDVMSIQSLLLKLEPKHVDDVEDVVEESEQQSEEIRQLLARDFSNPSVESGATPGSPRPRSISNVEQSAKSGLRLSSSVDVLPTSQKAPQARPPPGPVGRIPPPSQPNRKGAVFPPPPPYAPPTTVESSSQGRLPVTMSTVRDPFRPKLPPQYPSNTGSSLSDMLHPQARFEASKAVSAGGKIPQSISMDDKLSTAFGRLSSNDRIGSERKKSYGALDSESSVVGPKISQVLTPSRDENATRGMFGFSMFNRKKSNTSSSFQADLPVDKCLVEVGRILQLLGCSVMMKRGESKMKCEAPVKNEKMLVSITCTHEKGTTKVVFKKGRKDRSRVDAKEFIDFFSIVYDKFSERLSDPELAV